MTDFKIKNGDIVVDSSGRLVNLSERDAIFQSAVICMSAIYGDFIYDRELGSCFAELSKDDEDYVRKLELILNESLAEFENAYVRIIECGSSVIAELTIDGETRTEEVFLGGNV